MNHSAYVSRRFSLVNCPMDVFYAALAVSNWELAREADEDELADRAARLPPVARDVYSLLVSLGACPSGRERFVDAMQSGNLGLLEYPDLVWFRYELCNSLAGSWDPRARAVEGLWEEVQHHYPRLGGLSLAESDGIE